MTDTDKVLEKYQIRVRLIFKDILTFKPNLLFKFAVLTDKQY